MGKAALSLLLCWTLLVIAVTSPLAVSSSSSSSSFQGHSRCTRITRRRQSPSCIRQQQEPITTGFLTSSPLFVLSARSTGSNRQQPHTTTTTRTTPITTTTTTTLQATPLSSNDNENKNLRNDNDDNTTRTCFSQQEQQRQGILVLLTVPFAWGSFEPATRFIYALDPPLPPFLFSVAYYAVAAVALVTAATATTATTTTRQPMSSSSSSSSDELSISSTPMAPSSSSSSSRNDNNNNNASLLLWPTAGGIELGLYLFVGNALQVLGLKTIPSDRAAFLLQLTTIFVPLLEQMTTMLTTTRMVGNSSNDDDSNGDSSISKPGKVSTRMWIACIVALTGVGVMGLEGKEDNLSSSSFLALFQDPFSFLSLSNDVWNFSTGDALIMAAAVAYSFHCLRLQGYAQTTPPVQLAASKALTETICSAATVAALVSYYYYSYALSPARAPVVDSISSSSTLSLSSFAYDSGEEIVRFLSYIQNDITEKGFEPWLPAMWAVLWTGWVTVAYTIYAQSYGQSRVRPTTANLIYTIQPICTAIFAFCLLGETLGPAGFVGGALIGAAVLLVALPTEKTIESSKL